MIDHKALVVLSGGQDSTTCLFWAKAKFAEVHAITFNYGQRHEREVDAAVTVARMAGVASHEVLTLGPILKGTSPLITGEEPATYKSAAALPGGLEATFVPGRNILFLTLAANRAYCLGAMDLVTGVCEEDFGGYPDCREVFIQKMEKAIAAGIGVEMHIHTPLMHMNKSSSVFLANDLPGCMDALAYSHTCYHGQYPPNPHNHASLLRARGFRDAGLPDPLILRAKRERLLPKDYPDHGLVEGSKYGLAGGANA